MQYLAQHGKISADNIERLKRLVEKITNDFSGAEEMEDYLTQYKLYGYAKLADSRPGRSSGDGKLLPEKQKLTRPLPALAGCFSRACTALADRPSGGSTG
jgi:hypothetical protein